MMPTSPLVIDGSAPTEAEYVALQYQLWRRHRRTRLAGWALGLWLAALGYLVVRDYLAYHRLTDYYTAALLGLGTGVACGRGPWARRQLRRYYARTPALASPTRFELRAEGLRGQGRLSSLETAWGGITQARVVGPWLLLYVTEASFYYLDLRRLQPPATEADVLALLRAQAVPLAP